MVGDVLCRKSAQDTLTAIAYVCSLPSTAKTCYWPSPIRNSRIQTKILDWLSKAILEFNFAGMDAKLLVNIPKVALAAV